MENDTFKIGEVAEQCDVSRDTLRYWEERGVIPEPPRDASSGYRAYSPELVRRVRAVKHARELGLTLDDIARLFERSDRGQTCDELEDIARERIAVFRAEIERLRGRIDGLEALAEVCPGDLPATDCPVIDMFAER